MSYQMNDEDDRDIGYKDDDRASVGGASRRKFFRRKVCKACIGKVQIDYKEPEALKRFITERGRILPRRITGSCAKHQRAIALAIKRARALALLPFVTK